MFGLFIVFVVVSAWLEIRRERRVFSALNEQEPWDRMLVHVLSIRATQDGVGLICMPNTPF